MLKALWRYITRWLGLLVSLFITCFVLAAFAYIYLQSQLPDVSQLKDVQLQVPLQVFTSDGQLLGQYGPVHRVPVTIDQVPQPLINAVLATEDQRFYEHGGIDVLGLMRAASQLVITGTKSQGGSTITMQVARNFYLTRKKTFTRKLNEIMLAMKIDQELPKQKVLELYLNKVYFGERAYGVGAAAQVYYGKTLNQLTLGEMAMLAGLPQAPSTENPIVNPDAAKKRRDHVLARMLELQYINQNDYQNAVAEPIVATYHGQEVAVHAPYVGEMVRDLMVSSFGDDAYTHGFKVYTTVDSQLQTTAATAARSGLFAYDKRHGYRGPSANWGTPPVDEAGLDHWQSLLHAIPKVNGLRSAAVLHVGSDSVTVLLATGKQVEILWDGIQWARPKINDDTWGRQPRSPKDVLHPGDVIWVQANSDGTYWLSQIPQAQSAFVSLDPQNGAITSLVGGYDYRLSSFNRVIQAQRQPGSSFKPFIYAAALDKGYTLASVINDAPVVFFDPGTNKLWRPQNDTHKFYGPTTLRTALTQSRNLVSIRLLSAIGLTYAINYITRFGFTKDQLPHNLPLALGTASVTPLQMATAYASFANGGFRVSPYIIDHVVDNQGHIVYQAQPKVACANCAADSSAGAVADDGSLMPTSDNTATIDSTTAIDVNDTTPNSSGDNNPPIEQQAQRIISPEIAFLITSALQSVIQSGTGHGATVLNRTDIAGKTGTTSDFNDTWFDGYNSDIIATAWLGFDQPRSTHEFGAQAALPMWIQFMRVALANKPEHTMPQPAGIIAAQIDPTTGKLAAQGQSNAMTEYFTTDTAPQGSGSGSDSDASSSSGSDSDASSSSGSDSDASSSSGSQNDQSQDNSENDQNGQPLF